MKKIAFLSVLCLSACLYLSCEKDNSTPDTSENDTLTQDSTANPIDTTSNGNQDLLNGFIIDTIGHFGYDFSAGKSDTVDMDNNDGGVINWHPISYDSGVITYPQWDTVLWWRNDQVDTVNWENQIKNYGQVDVTSISSISTQWDTIIDPLFVGNVFGAACNDGYVLFEVVEVMNSDMWEAVVKYKFSTTNSF
ncbi:MAG: hypothetical protein ACOCWB_00580 [Bacteroidota bacterium]